MILKEIASCLHSKYDPEGKYHLDPMYSTIEKYVYKREDNENLWLTLSHASQKVYCISMTDSTGLITMRDWYLYEKNSIHCIGKERLVTKQGKAVLELLRESNGEAEQTITIVRTKQKNKGEYSL